MSTGSLWTGWWKKRSYTPGRFINASFDKASVYNERSALTIRTPEQLRFVVVQIAGLVARRIVNCAAAGTKVHRGERYGMIQFGSRLDLYLPMTCRVRVKKGDKTRAGMTVIGEMTVNQSVRNRINRRLTFNHHDRRDRHDVE